MTLLYHYGHLCAGELVNAKFENVVGVRASFNKPRYPHVLWASPADSDYGWQQWCNDEGFGDLDPMRRWMIELLPSARLLTIDTLFDLQCLVAAYPGEHLHLSTDIAWPLVARDYDAVHLTEAGQWATRMTVPDLYGWDCESLAIFRAADHVRIVSAPAAEGRGREDSTDE